MPVATLELTILLLSVIAFSIMSSIHEAQAKLGYIGLGYKNYDIAVDAKTDIVYALQCEPNQLFIINGSSPSTNSSISLGDYCPFKIDLNSDTNKLYVTAYYANTINKDAEVVTTKIIDASTGDELGEIPGYRVEAINEHTNMIYLVPDKQSGNIVTSPPDTVYGTDISDAILVVDGNSDEIIKEIEFKQEEKMVISVASNPKTDSVYAILFSLRHQNDPRTLITIDGRDNTLTGMNVSIDTFAAKLAVNEETSKIYVVNNAHYVGNASVHGSVTVIDSAGGKPLLRYLTA